MHYCRFLSWEYIDFWKKWAYNQHKRCNNMQACQKETVKLNEAEPDNTGTLGRVV